VLPDTGPKPLPEERPRPPDAAAPGCPVEFPSELVLPSDTDQVHAVQQAIIDELKARAFSEREIFSIKLALEEALVNAIKHGNQMDRSKTVRIAYQIRDDTFYVRICDEGQGFNPAEVPDPTQPENLERSCGRGLMLMRHYMNEVQFLGRGNVVLMWKCRNGRP
jgi:serine/threonine-protein kinase RsbW